MSAILRWLLTQATRGTLGQIIKSVLEELGIWKFVIAVPIAVYVAVTAMAEGSQAVAIVLMLVTIAVVLALLHYATLGYERWIRPRNVITRLDADCRYILRMEASNEHFEPIRAQHGTYGYMSWPEWRYKLDQMINLGIFEVSSDGRYKWTKFGRTVASKIASRQGGNGSN